MTTDVPEKPISPTRRPSLGRRVLGWVLIAGLWGALLVLLAFFGLGYAIYRDLRAPEESRFIADTRVESLAHFVFFKKFWTVWQSDARCAQFDPELLYVPRPGSVRFRTVEFDTTITMTADGLRQQPEATGDLILITGDSYTMGWGVNDDETFAAVLQRRYHRRTINSGVSSYGTARELLRLRRLGLLTQAKVLVIQFHPNDAPENQEFLATGDGRLSKRDLPALWKQIQAAPATVDVTYSGVLSGMVKVWRERAEQMSWPAAIAAPLRKNVQLSRQWDATFPNIAREFLAVIDSFPELREKLIVVTELKARTEPSRFLGDLRVAAADRKNMKIFAPELERSDYFRFDPHLRPIGNEKIAAQIDRAIRELAGPAQLPRE